MSEANPRPTILSPLTCIGLGLLALSLIWWFAYYAHHAGAFAQLDVKLRCLAGMNPACAGLQKSLGPIAIPAYRPWLWWAGVVACIVGLIQTRAGGPPPRR